MAESINYLKGVHVLVAVPDQLAELLELKEFEYVLHDLKALAIDEVDACSKVNPPDCQKDTKLPFGSSVICFVNGKYLQGMWYYFACL